MKIAINRDYGGFSLSEEAKKWLGDCDKIEYDSTENRTNPRLIACIEELGAKANGRCADIKIVEIPDRCLVDWEIDYYDGYETVKAAYTKTRTEEY